MVDDLRALGWVALFGVGWMGSTIELAKECCAELLESGAGIVTVDCVAPSSFSI